MKNYTTPRTLADCEFVTGNPIAGQSNGHNVVWWLLWLVGWLLAGAVVTSWICRA